MNKERTSTIKREQKKTLLFKELSYLHQELAQDEPDIAHIYITRVDLSADTGICYVYFAEYPNTGIHDEKHDEQEDNAIKNKASKKSHELFEKALEVLKLYKPSIRKALAKAIKSRYVPDIVFLYDEKKDKTRKLDEILNQVSDELHDQDHTHD